MTESYGLLLAAAGVALTHTLLGPDHYVPFIMLARVRGWNRRRTAVITLLCGLGHVLSSLLLAGIGIGLGAAIGTIQAAETSRGALAAWTLAGFGAAYGLWGLRRGIRKGRGLEPHAHAGHVHLHSQGDQPHQHGAVSSRSITPFWTLFAIFVLGPCEPLIPLFILPASQHRWGLAAATGIVFGLVTMILMVALTLAGQAGLQPHQLGRLARWDHALAGGIIALTGLAVLAFGL
ncbi:MAG: hypothetical protein ACE5ID_10905 [Acidobacteriota bacterium]